MRLLLGVLFLLFPSVHAGVVQASDANEHSGHSLSAQNAATIQSSINLPTLPSPGQILVENLDDDARPPVLIAESPYTFEETIRAVRMAVKGMNFRLVREQTLDHGFVPKGERDQKQHIIYFCNFKFLNDALKTDSRVGIFLPCRVTVVEHGGGVFVLAINPVPLSKFFDNPDLQGHCEDMAQIYRDLLEEVIL